MASRVVDMVSTACGEALTMATTAGTSLSRKIGSACEPTSGSECSEVECRRMMGVPVMSDRRAASCVSLAQPSCCAHLDGCGVAQQQRDEQQVRVPQDRHDRHGILGLLRGAGPLQHLLRAHACGITIWSCGAARRTYKQDVSESTSKSTMSNVSRPARTPTSFVTAGQFPHRAVLIGKAEQGKQARARQLRSRADQASTPT